MLRLPYLISLLRAGLLVLLLASSARAATLLRDAELVPAGQPVLENVSGSVRLEDARLGRLAPPVFVPEPDAPIQLGVGIALLYLLSNRRRVR